MSASTSPAALVPLAEGAISQYFSSLCHSALDPSQSILSELLWGHPGCQTAVSVSEWCLWEVQYHHSNSAEDRQTWQNLRTPQGWVIGTPRMSVILPECFEFLSVQSSRDYSCEDFCKSGASFSVCGQFKKNYSPFYENMEVVKSFHRAEARSDHGTLLTSPCWQCGTCSSASLVLLCTNFFLE